MYRNHLVQTNYLYNQIEKILGITHKPIHRDARKGDVRNSLADISKTIEQIQYNSIVDFGDGIKLTFEYYKNSYFNE